jgi:hypothetical protein
LKRRISPWPFALALLAVAAAPANASQPEPTGVDIEPRPCMLEGDDEYERRFYEIEGWKAPDYERYPGDCQRERYAHPVYVKPGQNDVLIEPLLIEKPQRDGYVTRIEPNLVDANGNVPPTEDVHLHHGTWLSQPSYGDGPFFAAGEEKTTAPWPTGYGMPVKASDTWLLLYMVHSAVQRPMNLYITYDIDFVPQEAAERLGLKPAYPQWLDVRPSGYPVFNTQRGFGKKGKCTWPKDECARFDPYGNEIVGQGEPGNGTGEDLQLPAAGESLGAIDNFQGGTLIGIGGHLHPGGIQNEIDLVRGEKSKRIYTGRAAYWNRKNTDRKNGPPTSWDFSMRVSGNPYWGIRVEPGDKLRSNATYDTKIQSTYENMGIAVTLLAPDTPEGEPTAPGVNPFKAPVDKSKKCKSGGLKAKKRPTLCPQGIEVTHGHLPENDNYGKAQGAWDAPTGSPASDVAIANFVYAPGDFSQISMTGVPTVKLGQKLNFHNLEAPLIYHTITSCGFPCKGPTGIAYPLADGETSSGGQVDYDSSELGFGTPYIGPTKQTTSWSLDVTKEEGFKPGDVSTYFCRIHPGMRGAFEVQK